MLAKIPLLGRLFRKLFCEFLPAAAVSLLGAALLNHYNRAPAPPPTVVADPASAEMLEMARDEHARIVVYLEKHEEAEQAAAAKIKAAEQVAAAAQKTKAAQAKITAIAAPAPDATVRKVSAKPSLPKLEPAVVIAEPLVLSSPPGPATVKLTPPAKRADDNVIVTKFRETTAAVERVPGWLRGQVERVADGISSIPLPRLPPIHHLL